MMDELPPYVISGDRGGRVIERVTTALDVADSGRLVRIEGLCASACTVYLALTRVNRVCLGPGAVLAFHQTTDIKTGKTNPKANKIVLSFYPISVQNWIKARGGLTAKLLVMDFAEARKHVRVCPS